MADARPDPRRQQWSAGTYDTKEGKLTLGANEDHQYERLCRALGLASVLTDPRFQEIDARRKNTDILRAEFRRVLLTRTADEWEGLLNNAGVPAARIRTPAEILQHPQVTGRGVLHTFKNVKGVERDVTVLSTPFRLGHDGPTLNSPPPLIGEHSDAILGELGYSRDEIQKLREAGVV